VRRMTLGARILNNIRGRLLMLTHRAFGGYRSGANPLIDFTRVSKPSGHKNRPSELKDAIINAYISGVMGESGIDMQAKTGNTEFNTVIEDRFRKWCQSNRCDRTGRFSIYDIQEFAVGKMVADGMMFIQEMYEKDKDGKLKYTLLGRDIDQLDFKSNGRDIFSGIKIDNYGKHLEYYFKNRDNERFTVSADDIICLATFENWQDVHGTSILNKVSSLINRLEDYIDCVLRKARNDSAISGVIESEPGFVRGFNDDAITTGRDENQNKVVQIEPGSLTVLEPGQKYSPVNPPAFAANVANMVSQIIHIVSAAVSLSYEAVSRDLKGANFSATRQALIMDRQVFSRMQSKIGAQFMARVYAHWLENAIANGEIEVPAGMDMEELFKSEFVRPKMAWIDPAKEASAYVKSIEGGIMSPQAAMKERGQDWDDFKKDTAEAVEFFNELGIAYPIATNSTDISGETETENEQ